MQEGLDLGQALLVGGDGALCLVHVEVLFDLELADGLGKGVVEVVGLGGLAGDDERGAGLVDEDGVDLVDDAVVVAALDALVGRGDHVVAQVVEAELGVGAVGDVCLVSELAQRGGRAVLEQAHGQAEEAVDAAHPLGVALGEVVVDRDHVHAVAGEGVEIDGQGGDQSLALACAHLGDLALVEHHAADELHVEVAHAGGAHRCLADHSEGLREELVEGLAVAVALAELVGLCPELLVAEGLHLVFKVVDDVDLGLELLELAIRAEGQELGEKVCHSPFFPDECKGIHHSITAPLTIRYRQGCSVVQRA